jgi:hypothetical protein
MSFLFYNDFAMLSGALANIAACTVQQDEARRAVENSLFCSEWSMQRLLQDLFDAHAVAGKYQLAEFYDVIHEIVEEEPWIASRLFRLARRVASSGVALPPNTNH